MVSPPTNQYDYVIKKLSININSLLEQDRKCLPTVVEEGHFHIDRLHHPVRDVCDG